MTKRVIVTGGSGLAGKWVVEDLIQHGYEVLNLDRVPLAKGTKIQSRTLNKTFYAPVMHVTGPAALKLSAVLARPSARALTLRVVLRHPDGTLSGENIPLG